MMQLSFTMRFYLLLGPKDRRRNKITFFSPVRVCQIAIDFSGRSENKSRIRDMK